MASKGIAYNAKPPAIRFRDEFNDNFLYPWIEDRYSIEEVTWECWPTKYTQYEFFTWGPVLELYAFILAGPPDRSDEDACRVYRGALKRFYRHFGVESWKSVADGWLS